MNRKLKWISIGFAVCALIGLTIYAYALTSWTHEYTWLTSVEEFEVYKDAGLTTLWDTGGITDLGVDPTSHSETYYIKNIGTVDITVTGTVTFTSGTAIVSWAPSDSITLSPGSSGSLTLTLSSFSAETGSCQVTFTVA